MEIKKFIEKKKFMYFRKQTTLVVNPVEHKSKITNEFIKGTDV